MLFTGKPFAAIKLVSKFELFIIIWYSDQMTD
jgi:hypothetical protein